MNHTVAHYQNSTDDKKLVCLKYYQWAMQNDIKRMVIADDQYYQKTLEQRRDILSAPSINFLCKTIVFENTAYDEKFAGKFYPKYIAVMVQYVAKINTEKLNKVVRVWQQNNCHEKASKQFFHYRLADEKVSGELTGYEHNGVVPVLMRTNMPIFFSHEIKALHPEFFWMGAGHPEIKMRISFSDFKRTYPDSLLIEDITYSEGKQE